MMKRVLVVGGGWLGIPLAKALSADGHHVKVSARSREKCERLTELGLNAIQLNFGDGTERQSLPHCDVLIVTVPPREGQEQSELVLQQIAEAVVVAKIPQVVYCSSTAVYPDLNREVFVEDAMDFPSAHSGVRLLKLEQVFSSRTDFSTSVLRFGGLFGPDRDPARFLRNEVVHRGPENPVNMTHLDDCIEGVRRIIKEAPVSTIRNVVRTPHLSRREFYGFASQAAGLPEPVWGEGELPWKKVMV